MNLSLKTLISSYQKSSDCAKVLFFISLLFIIVTYFKNKKIEGFESGNDSKFQFKQKSVEIYDKFYSNIYDQLVFSRSKTDFEVSEIKKLTNPNSKNVILDIGSGTGHHVAKLSSINNTEIVGIDNSSSMIKKAKKNYPSLNFEVKDVSDGNIFMSNTFTHILCFYFTVYYFKDKEKLFINCMKWLKPGGYMIIHLIDKSNFDPIVPPSNPLYVISPQKYSKKRLTKSKVTFNNFIYESNFKTDVENNVSIFEEKFIKKDNSSVRKHEHKLYIEDKEVTARIAQDVGFIIQGVVNLVNCGYDNQYLYVFVKPQ
jgi:ubiquinone/menaquinone biosynthesis C-methylase UbiE